jgi:hypothetical protein
MHYVIRNTFNKYTSLILIMVVVFSKQFSNYNQQNIVDLLNTVPDHNINYLINHPTDHIKVMGDIHRSQITSDNPNNNFWLKIRGLSSEFDTGYLNSVHIFVCFREYNYNKRARSYTPGKCINPSLKSGTDLADISQLSGYWEFVKITFSHAKPIETIAPKKSTKNPKKKSVKPNAARDEMIRLFRESIGN